MNSKPKLAALASATMLFGTSTAFADDDYRTAQASAGTYAYAEVISSQPIIRYVTVRTPVRECWEETQYYTVNQHPGQNAGGTFLGAVIGGVIGHQFGSGRGQDVATVAGTLIGAAVGNDAARKRHSQDAVEQEARQVQHCNTSYREHREERIDGYNVTYRYYGQKYRTEMPYDPGQKLRIRVDVRPAG